ncbi:hypothetical protein COCSADRAFT_353612 [Bipolaris sorokiniana ND90Pr]|uniref:Uncharacterized protein n=1 Tax=Cochliobolus sativus (strain ND90Pr / ATCC 201652) TaxID=665912 RepID=M2TAZ6_COCSN|nr:uncharacterized protein COCSADRAFT_353612 [Bipolaris sorokiniana ND90Pr]EMD66396.1 hypothetical protein COCSADRAFT_353612 [Bipolaris sorokiniana ND90Pr]
MAPSPTPSVPSQETKRAMSSQDTIPDDTLYQGYQNCLSVRDNVVYPAVDRAEPASASKQSGNKSKEQPGKFTSRETKEAASHTNASKAILPTDRVALKNYIERKPEESHTEVVDFLEELKNIKGQLEHTLGNVEDLVSRLQEATEQHTHKTLPMSGKLVRWADSTGTYSAKHDIHRARKKARGKF